VTKAESTDPVAAGSGPGNLVYTVTVTNNGPSDAGGVTLSEVLTLPAGVTVDSVVPSAGSFAGDTWTVGSLPAAAGETLTVTLTVDGSTAPGTDVIGDTATVTAVDEPDSNAVNDSATESTSVLAPADVTGTKTVAGEFQENGTVTYTVVLTNASFATQVDDPASDEFTDALPPELELLGATADSGVVTTNLGDDLVTWNGSIPAGGQVEITIDAIILYGTQGSSVSNQGVIAYDADGDGSNEANRHTDEPGVAGDDDPTSFEVASILEIPALSPVGLALLALLLLAGGLRLSGGLRRRR
ncbi:MAG: DUF11 domain-containing protein, partial [Halobacteriales archaeon]|nr:DUF11 domain-containing protein [Halobacteriales archaeon]